MATKKKAPSKATRPGRDHIINVRLSTLERSYLAEGADRESTGPMPLAGFLRGLGLMRASQNLGYTFADFEARGAAAPQAGAAKSGRKTASRR